MQRAVVMGEHCAVPVWAQRCVGVQVPSLLYRRFHRSVRRPRWKAARSRRWRCRTPRRRRTVFWRLSFETPLRRALRTRNCLAARFPTLMARQGRASRTTAPRCIVCHVRWSRPERVTPGILSRSVSSRPSWVAVRQPISLLRAAPRYRMRIHGPRRPIDQFITAPTERRQLR